MKKNNSSQGIGEQTPSDSRASGGATVQLGGSVVSGSANTLKTLKDLKKEEIEEWKETINMTESKKQFEISTIHFFCEEKLKAEAVKRARYFKERIKWAKEKDFRVKEKLDAYFQGRFNEVMEANDLTEKDLE